MTEPLKVLIVEDEALLAMELESLIEEAGHSVVGWATSSDEARSMVDSTDADISCGAANRFVARATGGVWLYSGVGPSTGVALLAGSGSWSSISDRAVKDNVAAVDPVAILEKLASIPVATWNYAAQSKDIRHIGPMAQDFHATFDVGEDERFISTVDAQGVAFAAIQGLHALVREKDAQIEALRREMEDLRLEVRRAASR